jgi:hypothetical protein
MSSPPRVEITIVSWEILARLILAYGQRSREIEELLDRESVTLLELAHAPSGSFSITRLEEAHAFLTGCAWALVYRTGEAEAAWPGFLRKIDRVIAEGKQKHDEALELVSLVDLMCERAKAAGATVITNMMATSGQLLIGLHGLNLMVYAVLPNTPPGWKPDFEWRGQVAVCRAVDECEAVLTSALQRARPHLLVN